MRAFWLLLFLVPACGNADEQRAKLAEAEKAADQRVAKAEADGKNKLADVQKELDQAKTDLADAKTKLEEAGKAQSATSDTCKNAEAALGKAREAFKALGRLELADANKEVAELTGKAAKAPAKVKAVVNPLIQQIPAQQKAINKDIADYDTAEIETFKAVKAKLDHDLATMRGNVRTAKAKIPAS
jgi:chromosome segregation ATPase